MIDQDAILLNRALLERHEVEHECCRLGDAIRQADPGTIGCAKDALLVLGQWSRLDTGVEFVGVDLCDVDRKPFFKLRSGHDGPAFRIILAFFFNIGKRRAFEPASPGQPSPESSFDMAPVPRFSWWAVGDGEIVIAARTTDHCSTEVLRVVAMDFMHLPPARPLGLKTDIRDPMFFWQHCMRDCEACCESARFLQIDSET